ncbi:MAG: hypothetical protein ACJ72E_00720, partial [Marmoricola sp.]
MDEPVEPAEDPWESLFADSAEQVPEVDPEVDPDAEPERPVDRGIALRVAALVLVVGIVIQVVHHRDHMYALQQCFVLGGLALIGLWLSSALVETDRGREVARSSMIGVVGGLAGA